MAAAETDEAIMEEVDLFGKMMEQSVLLNEFDREFAPIAGLQQGAPIEFLVKGADQLYLDLNESVLYVVAKITMADGTNIAAATAGPINLMLHSLFAQVSVEFNGKPVSEPNHLYPYRAYLETLINYSEETQKTRLLAKGWTKDTSGHMGVTAVNGNNAGLVTRTARFATSTEVELVGRPHLDVFQQNKLIPAGVDLHLKLIPSASNFVIKSAAAGQNQQQENYKAVIMKAVLVMHTKQLTAQAEMAHRELLRERVMRLPYTRL